MCLLAHLFLTYNSYRVSNTCATGFAFTLVHKQALHVVVAFACTVACAALVAFVACVAGEACMYTKERACMYVEACMYPEGGTGARIWPALAS
jgi:hypothetical protein